MNAGTSMPVGLTVMSGNTLDVTHFKETFRQLLPADAMIVFETGRTYA